MKPYEKSETTLEQESKVWLRINGLLMRGYSITIQPDIGSTPAGRIVRVLAERTPTDFFAATMELPEALELIEGGHRYAKHVEECGSTRARMGNETANGPLTAKTKRSGKR